MDPVSLGLPHREPFVFVDAVQTLVPGVSSTGVKVFSGDEPFFRGHFPEEPIVPGVLLTEALAQMAGIAGAAGTPGTRFLLSAIRSMKFPSAARPKERISLHAEKIAVMGGLWNFAVRANVDERIVAEGQVILSQAT